MGFVDDLIDKMDTEVDERQTKREDILKKVEDNKKKPDKDGFVFFSNQKKGESTDFETLRQVYKFKMPVVKFKKAKIFDDKKKLIKEHGKERVERELKEFAEEHESIWVKEGLKVEKKKKKK